MSDLYDTYNQEPPRLGLTVLQVLILVLFAMFSLRFWYLQVHKGQHFANKARDNQLRQERVYAPRGLISDVNGELLAVNEPAYALGLIREDCHDVEGTLAKVAEWTGVPEARLEESYHKNRRRVKPFEPLILISDLTFEQLAVIEAKDLHWPGLEIVTRARRKYRYGKMLAHVMGYVGDASESELEQDSTLSLGDNVGKQGLELMMEKRLRGAKGLRQLEVDVSGRHLGETMLRPPQAGEDLHLSIDIGLQRMATDWFEGKEGSVIVMDADSGQLRALVSAPSYDSNDFTMGLSAKKWRELRDDPMHPLQNRVTQSVYPPGSVFKLVMAGAGLHEDMIDLDETVTCTGALQLGNHVFHCWRRGGHGKVNLERALVESCDVFFYKLGLKLGVDRIEAFAKACGFGSPTGIDLPHEKSGLIPSREWKRKRFGERWQKGENLNLAIGQGFTQVSPLQVTRFVAAVINGGKLLKPQLLAGVPPTVDADLPLTDRQRDIVEHAMVETVENPHGTCRRLRTTGVAAGGKTGTAQVIRLTDEIKKLKDKEIPYKYRDHAWMAAFAEKDGHRYAIVAMVEHGLHGGSGAGPVIKKCIDYLFAPEKVKNGTNDDADGPPASAEDDE